MKKLLKKLFIIAFSITAIVSLTAFATSCFRQGVNFKYTLIDGGKAYELTECRVFGKVEDRTITVPSTYRGLPVKGIGAGCFCYDAGMFIVDPDMMRIEKLYLPPTIEYVKGRAFYGQSQVEVYIQDLSAWCNISFASISANPLGRMEYNYWHESLKEYNVDGANLYLNGELVENLVIPSGITKIKDYAFFGGKFKSVDLGNEITEIGDKAFAACSKLETVSIPDSVEKIGEMAFSTANICQVFVGENVSQIGEDAFSGTNHLVEVVNNSKNLTFTKGGDDNGGIAKYALGVYNRGEFSSSKITRENGDVLYVEDDEKYLVIANYEGEEEVIAEGVTVILRCAFINGFATREITIPKSVNKIVERAFYKMGNANVKYYGTGEDWCKIDGIDNLTSIVEEVSFENLTDGTINVPTWMTDIPEGFLKNCINVEKVVLHEGVVSIGDGSFNACKQLKTINFPSKIERIGNEAFEDCQNLQGELNLPAELKELGREAFLRCGSLVGTVEIPVGVTVIKSDTFSNCKGISSVVLHDGVVSIGSYAFADCTGMKEVFYLPLSIKEIGWNSFSKSGITTLQYAGTQSQFWDIDLAYEWNSYKTIKSVICKDGRMRIAP